MNVTLAEKRQLGAYYTPDAISRALAAWAIRSPDNVILEPSFGGCSLLAAAMSQLASLGAVAPLRQLFGCDIDDRAFVHLYEMFGCTESPERFLRQDFVTTSLSDFSVGPFDAVIGNPPFVSHRAIPCKTKEAILNRECFRSPSVQLPATAGLWAYFLVHAMSFLKDGGRMAFVVPRAILYTKYATRLRFILSNNFSEIRLVKINFPAFKAEGAAEKPVVLLCDGYNKGRHDGRWPETAASDPDEAVRFISPKKLDLPCAVQRSGDAALNRGSVSNEAAARWASLMKESGVCCRLGTLATIRIGIVTGATKYFVVNQETAAASELPEDALVPVIARAAQVAGIQYDERDQQAALDAGVRCLLIAPKSLGEKRSAVRKYFARVPRDIRRKTLWFKKRPNWFCPQIPELADAVLSGMTHWGPRLTLLQPPLACTNTLYAVSLSNSLSANDRKILAISFMTSFTQLAAEETGRVYGGGLLKLEPSEAKELPVLLPKLEPVEVDDAFAQLDILCRAGSLPEATALADRVIFSAVINEQGKVASQALTATLTFMRALRMTK